MRPLRISTTVYRTCRDPQVGQRPPRLARVSSPGGLRPLYGDSARRGRRRHRTW